MSNLENIWSCPKCNKIETKEVNLYSNSLRVQNFQILPLLPTCKICGSEITLNKKERYTDGKLIILTGTCASGKTTTAETLKNKYGFHVIDGDCVLQVLKYKLGFRVEYNSNEAINEIIYQLDILLSLKKNIVLTQVIIPKDIYKYRKIFKRRNLNYKIFLLQPNYESAVKRSKSRTCFDSITDEKWIKYFYEELKNFDNDEDNDIIKLDNTNQTVEESTITILKYI